MWKAVAALGTVAGMSPVAHLLGSWLVAVGACSNARDRRLVMLAGVAPDLDGLGIVVDILRGGDGSPFYQAYHHQLLHGIFGAALLAGLAALWAKEPMRVLITALLVIHLHLICDLMGSRGPEPVDVWPIPYLAPFSQSWTFMWKGQWELVGPENIAIAAGMVVFSLWLAARVGHSPACLLGERVDGVFVATLRKWVSVARTEAPAAVGEGNLE